MIPNCVTCISKPSRHAVWAALGLLLLFLCRPLDAAQPPTTHSLQVRHSDPANLAEALNRIYGERLRTAQVQEKLVLSGDDATVAAALELARELDAEPRTLTITLRREAPPKPGTTTYRAGGAGEGWQTRVQSGETLILRRSREQPQLTGAGWGWVQIEQRPLREENLMLQAFAQDERVHIVYDYRQQHGPHRQQAASRLSAPLGEWIQLVGPHSGNGADLRRYRSGGHVNRQPLWLQVTATPATP